ncbi:MAG: DUF1403 family protein, partial [Mesorhizobium sp.]
MPATTARTEDENTLRDHFYLRRDGDDPGPAGLLYLAWRFLGTPAAVDSKAWPSKLADMLGLRMDDALQDVFAHASDQLRGEGSAVRAAAAVATKSLRLRPGSRPLALWLADA